MIRSPLNQLEETPQSPKKRSIKGSLRRIERVSLRHAHKFVVRRITNLREVRRHALGWFLLVIGMSALALWQGGISAQQYTQRVPVEGGVFTEGTLGPLDTLNPLFASTPAERSASRLLFASLLTYDQNSDLVGELARSWEVDDSGRVYTVRLKSAAKWQDGTPLTADDIMFTFSLIKDADTRSPLYASWRNIGVEKVDAQTVRFVLPVPYAAFPNSLVVGILPQHVLKGVHPTEMRTLPNNRAPTIASGPFQFQDLSSLDTSQNHYLLRMVANKYFVRGEPKLRGFQLHAYKDSETIPKGFNSQEIAGFSEVSLSQFAALNNPAGATRIDAPLYNGVYAFLKTDSPFLADEKVRRALQYATNQQTILELFNGAAQPLTQPLLPGQLGYRTDIAQPAVNHAQAAALLDEAGWLLGSDNKRRKDGQPLRLRMVTVNSGNYTAVAEELMRQWALVGVEFDPLVVKPEDVQQNIIIPRAYDVLVYEIAIGRDPDVYAYWHSSQASSTGLNLSNYKSVKADDELDGARSRLDTALREAKYRMFVQQWINDAPAIGLYRPSLTYVQNRNATTFAPHPLVDPTDRYYNVRTWSAEMTVQRPTR